MSGNLLEWCLTDYSRPALDAAGENLMANTRRVVRGGSWHDSQVNARASFRAYGLPFYRLYHDGFRVLRPILDS